MRLILTACTALSLAGCTQAQMTTSTVYGQLFCAAEGETASPIFDAATGKPIMALNAPATYVKAACNAVSAAPVSPPPAGTPVTPRAILPPVSGT